jgi:hypothetical protein
MTASAFPKRVKISDNVLFQHLDNECVLLNMESEQYFGLDDVSARIWQLLTEDGDTEKLLNTLLAEYDVDEATLKKDLTELFSRLENEKLIVKEDL